MANLQIKGLDDALHEEIHELAVEENRTISEQILFILREYVVKRRAIQKMKTPAQLLLELSGSWKDSRGAETIIKGIKKARKESKKLKAGSIDKLKES